MAGILSGALMGAAEGVTQVAEDALEDMRENRLEQARTRLKQMDIDARTTESEKDRKARADEAQKDREFREKVAGIKGSKKTKDTFRDFKVKDPETDLESTVTRRLRDDGTWEDTFTSIQYDKYAPSIENLRSQGATIEQVYRMGEKKKQKIPAGLVEFVYSKTGPSSSNSSAVGGSAGAR